MIQDFAGHGYNLNGMQAVGTPFYDAASNSMELIPVENMIRSMKIPNTYVWTEFACCREVTNLSDVNIQSILDKYPLLKS